MSERRDPLRWKIAVSLAALVVLGAGLAILQRGASVNESNTARETTRVAVRAMSANVAVTTLQRVEPDLRPPGFDRLRVRAEQQTLAQQALTATRIAWNDRSTQYTTVIALLAAALFLVGFGLVVDGSLRRVSYGAGLVVAACAAGWAAWLHQEPIPATAPAAVAAAARGAVLTDDGRYREAIGAYDRAIAADGDYDPAFTGRSRARLLAANPDFPKTRAYTDARGRASAAAVRDAERALALNRGRDILGFALVALQAFYSGDYDRTLSATSGALAINPRVPDVLLVRSAAEVAVGDGRDAARSLAVALHPLEATEPSARFRLLASTYLSYLGWVAHREPARAGAAKGLSERVIRSETAFTLRRSLPAAPPVSGRVRVGGLRYADGRLTMRLRWEAMPRGTALSTVVYERPLTDGAWAQPPDLAWFTTVAGSGSRRTSVRLSRACPPGEVRVDVFVDGAAAGSVTGPGAPRSDRCG